jgi:hypothetical protein
VGFVAATLGTSTRGRHRRSAATAASIWRATGRNGRRDPQQTHLEERGPAAILSARATGAATGFGVGSVIGGAMEGYQQDLPENQESIAAATEAFERPPDIENPKNVAGTPGASLERPVPSTCATQTMWG